MSAVQIHGLSKRFGASTALADIDFELDADELLVVLGPTGAGKTTLLRCLAGLEHPDAGVVRIHGRDASELSPADRDVAFVFQHFALYPGWTVRRNLAFPLRAPGRRLPADRIAERVAWAARLLHIEHLLDRRSNRLSGGEMQRVAIGRAIVRQPALFLLDEPLTNLDAKLREQLRLELVALRRAMGCPMIYVTHDQSEALAMGDRIAVLVGGRLRQIATPTHCYRRPADPRVAAIVGQPPINLWPAERSHDGWQTPAGLIIPLRPRRDAPADGVDDKVDAERVTVGVRPEAIAAHGGADEARVLVVEDTGPMLVLVVDWHGEHVRLLGDPAAPPRVGDRIRPRIDPERVLVWPDRDGSAAVRS